MRIRALIDQGSDASFLSKSIAKKLDLGIIKTNASVSGVGGIERSTIIEGETSCIMSARDEYAQGTPVQAFVLKRVSNYVPPVENASVKASLSQLELADPDPYSRSTIDMIIGADLYAKIIKPGLEKIGDSLVAQQTTFGWIVTGLQQTYGKKSKLHEK